MKIPNFYKGIILGLLIILTLFNVNQAIKTTLQNMIVKNYDARYYHKLPDKWYWFDLLYMKLYGDYSFYKFPDGYKPF